MKRIGLIGGLSWESTALYYKLINELVRDTLGGLNSADCVIHSFNFAEIAVLQKVGDWDRATERMIAAAQGLERAGAEMLIICANTMHKMADQVQTSVNIPLIHIADATADRVQAADITQIGLLGTRYTMDQDFYKGRLADKFGLTVIVPDAPDREIVNAIIYDELCLGMIRSESKAEYMRITRLLVDNGAQGVILGCTEITMLISQADSSVPVFDTTAIHAERAVELALEKVGNHADPTP